MERPTPVQRYAYRHFLAHLETLDPPERSVFLEKLDPGLFHKPETEFFAAIEDHRRSKTAGKPARFSWLRAIAVLALAGLLTWIVNDSPELGTGVETIEDTASFHNPWGVPGTVAALHRQAYSFQFDTEKKTPVWVSYRVQTTGPHFREDAEFDPAFPEQQRNPDAYEGTDYEKGSLITPSHVRGAKNLGETQYHSVTVPLTTKLRASVLSSIRKRTAKLAAKHKVWVTIGPIFDGAGPTSLDGAPVPDGYFFIVSGEGAGEEPRLWAFALPNTPEIKDTDPAQFLVSVDRIEALTGLDFFNLLSEDSQRALEQNPSESLWW